MRETCSSQLSQGYIGTPTQLHLLVPIRRATSRKWPQVPERQIGCRELTTPIVECHMALVMPLAEDVKPLQPVTAWNKLVLLDMAKITVPFGLDSTSTPFLEGR